MPSFTNVFLAAFILTFGLKLWLALRQMRHVYLHRDALPTAFADSISEAEHRKAIGQIADIVLPAERKSATYFNSFTSAVTLVNCLVAGVSMKSKRSLKMLKAFDQVDNEWSYFLR